MADLKKRRHHRSRTEIARPYSRDCRPLQTRLSVQTSGEAMQIKKTNTILNFPRAQKRLIALMVDVVICLAAVSAAYFLRLNSWIFPQGWQWLSYGLAAIIAIPLFITFGLYRAIFRYAGWGALMAVVRACVIFGLLYALVFTVIGVPQVPRTIGLIQPILLFLGIGASRAMARYWLGEGYAALFHMGPRRQVLIYGAGSAGRQLAAALANSDEMYVIGFVDDDPTLKGSVLSGHKIYPSDNVSQLIETLFIDDVLLALPSATRRRRTEIVTAIRASRATIRTLPGLIDLAQGKVTVNDLRELDIEDLLGRDPVEPDPLLLGRRITGKTVLVTGAGGSIGGELCRQILSLQPKILLLLEKSEYSLYTIHQELAAFLSDHNSGEKQPRIIPLLASVQDEQRTREIFRTWRPDTIYHAAAYKHVPLVEHNPCEGIRNNVFGTYYAAQIAQEEGVSNFVLISTDKAVRPTNVMGTTKRLAELVLQAIAAENPATVFSMVRFGNVLGSSGSVVPLFRKQIKAGGPVTITHKDVTRYFMSIPEAAQLVIQAGAMAQGGEVFVLDMGDPVRIADLAQQMIELSGLSVKDAENPDGDIEIHVVGLRPGEKLYEELLIGNAPETTAHPRILKANEEMRPLTQITQDLADFEVAIGNNDQQAIRTLLTSVVPDFIPQSDLVDWVYLEQNGLGEPE